MDEAKTDNVTCSPTEQSDQVPFPGEDKFGKGVTLMSPGFHLMEHADHIPLFDEARLHGDDNFPDTEEEETSSNKVSKNGTSNDLSEEHVLSLSSELDGSSRTSLSSYISEPENDVDGTETEKLDDTVTDKDFDFEFNVKNRISMLHCYICGKYYIDPRLLNCLHTFCLGCLKGLIFYKENHKIECVVCRQRTQIPDGGMASLPINVIIKNLLTHKTEVNRSSCCEICSLHGLESEVTGQCLDCNDMMCNECCEKHTYSRQTAKHNVVSLQDIINDSQQEIKRPREHTVMNCPLHEDEKLKFYCVACEKIVCRDCVLVSHNLHQVLTSDQVIQKIKDEIENKVEQLNELKEDKSKEIEQYEEKLAAEEKKEKQSLEAAYKEIISTVEEKYKVCLENLTEQYQELRQRKIQRQEKFAKITDSLEETEKNIKFLVDQGQDSEIANMQSLIKDRLNKLENDFKRLGPNIYLNATRPFVDIYSDNCMTVKKMMLFRAVRPKNSHNSDSSRNRGRSGTDKNSNSAQNLSARLANLGLDKQPKVSMRPAGMWQGPKTDQVVSPTGQTSLLGEYSPPSATSGLNSFGLKCNLALGKFQNDENVWQRFPNQDSQNRTSLLQHFLRNDGPDKQNFRKDLNMFKKDNVTVDSDSHTNFTRDHQNYGSNNTEYKHRVVRVPKVIGQQGESLVLKATLSVKVMRDEQEPSIAGMTFVGKQDFAVCDANNGKIKIFSSCGKFLYVLRDFTPMTVTFCNGHLIWNGRSGKVLSRPTGTGEHRIRKKRFQPDVDHPVTTFQDDKYLVANVQGKISAFMVDGKYITVHQIRKGKQEGKYFGIKTYIVTPHENRLTETVLMRGHKAVSEINFFCT